MKLYLFFEEALCLLGKIERKIELIQDGVHFILTRFPVPMFFFLSLSAKRGEPETGGATEDCGRKCGNREKKVSIEASCDLCGVWMYVEELEAVVVD